MNEILCVFKIKRMKKYIFVLVLGILILAPSFSQTSSEFDVNNIVQQFILENGLPIVIDEEIKFYGYFDARARKKFQVFILNIQNTLSRQLSEGLFYCINELTDNIIELNRILTAFYNYCARNNLELAIIINNAGSANEMIIDYLKHFNYSFENYNDLFILDSGTEYAKLSRLLGFLLQKNIIASTNLRNYFLHDWNDKPYFISRRITLVNGQVEIVQNDYLDFLEEMVVLLNTNNIIGDILFIFGVRNYMLPEYEGIWNEILEKNRTLERVQSEWWFNQGTDAW